MLDMNPNGLITTVVHFESQVEAPKMGAMTTFAQSDIQTFFEVGAAEPSCLHNTLSSGALDKISHHVKEV